MIQKHSSEFLAASQVVEIEILPISEELKRRYTLSVYSNFAIGKKYKYPLWENLTDWVGVDFPFSWEWFETILRKKRVLFFFEPDENDKMFEINNGEDIPKILNEAYRFTFYVTDYENSFLLCYNDHDNLIAAGDAMRWMKDFLANHHPTLKIIKSPKPN